ncbi:MAG: homoserine dehydrogenase [Pirellulaceae bacterium]
MEKQKIVVLKFGGSVLAGEDDLPTAVGEIYRWVSNGYRVVAVVSAIGSTTNRLFNRSHKYGARLNPHTIARLVSTGEVESAALLGLALDRVGLANEVHDDTSLQIRTEGDVLDAEITSIDSTRLSEILKRAEVVVVPGFVGRGQNGMSNLLGRGGSDLTALCIAEALGADHCFLVKDVDGLFEWDPKRSGAPRQYQQISISSALQLDEAIVQHKAVRLAKRLAIPFHVGSMRSTHVTAVGDFKSDQFYSDRTRVEPLRIGLLGLGTVGLGVYEQLRRNPMVQVEWVGVRDRSKAVDHGAPASITTNDPLPRINDDIELVIELIGGIEDAYNYVQVALKSGKHVITANKSMMAAHGVELAELAAQQGVRLLFSAAVGGGVPMLETVARIARHDEIVHLEGVLNGTCNFVLDRVAAGIKFREAVFSAQREGFAEADPSRDLDGVDAAEKLALMIWKATGELNNEDIQAVPVSENSISQVVSNAPGHVIRQVSTWQKPVNGSGGESHVRLVNVPAGHPFAKLQGEDNCLKILTASGKRYQLVGKGAGRFPTSQSVLNDLNELLRHLSRQTETLSETPVAI